MCKRTRRTHKEQKQKNILLPLLSNISFSFVVTACISRIFGYIIALESIQGTIPTPFKWNRMNVEFISILIISIYISAAMSG